ncbi:hypothetical protein [Salegentibacter sp. 24]|uniref:hypothetical protein n=1 Tax=Salegentibacter sp. 24 TaxID=2183986 RepID=UPI00105C6A04|nr:hypothetical protein [Salegentibacter sp. 24]
MENTTGTKPTKKEKRIDIFDVHLGFAIFGIFVVNIVIMNSTFLDQYEIANLWRKWFKKMRNH